MAHAPLCTQRSNGWRLMRVSQIHAGFDPKQQRPKTSLDCNWYVCAVPGYHFSASRHAAHRRHPSFISVATLHLLFRSNICSFPFFLVAPAAAAISPSSSMPAAVSKHGHFLSLHKSLQGADDECWSFPFDSLHSCRKGIAPALCQSFAITPSLAVIPPP